MKYTIFEDTATHRCTYLPLPRGFVVGDELPAVATDRWFESHAAAIAALAELLDRDEGESTASADVQLQGEAPPPPPIDPTPRPVVWPHH